MTREPAYADVVAGLLDATPSTATERFDAELADAVAQGLDATTARTLRWWQRESARAVRDHATAVLPALMEVLVQSETAQTVQTAAPPAMAVAPPAREPGHHSDDARRRTLVAGLVARSDAETA